MAVMPTTQLNHLGLFLETKSNTYLDTKLPKMLIVFSKIDQKWVQTKQR